MVAVGVVTELRSESTSAFGPGLALATPLQTETLTHHPDPDLKGDQAWPLNPRAWGWSQHTYFLLKNTMKSRNELSCSQVGWNQRGQASCPGSHSKLQAAVPGTQAFCALAPGAVCFPVFPQAERGANPEGAFPPPPVSSEKGEVQRGQEGALLSRCSGSGLGEDTGPASTLPPEPLLAPS